jgi:hypothetical protein
MMEELTTQMRSKREFSTKIWHDYDHGGHRPPSSFNWKLKIEFLKHFYSRNYEDEIEKWQGTSTLKGPIYRLKQKAK